MDETKNIRTTKPDGAKENPEATGVELAAVDPRAQKKKPVTEKEKAERRGRFT